MKEHGLMINSMEQVKKSGQIPHSMRESLLKEKSMVKEKLCSLISQLTVENSNIMKYMDMEIIYGLIIEGIKVNGHLTK